jgi:hypothetical protein
MVGTIVILEHKQKYGPADSFGRRCMKIQKDIFPHAPNAKGSEKYPKGMLWP